MLAYAEAHAQCEAKARMPLAAPVPLNARTLREADQLAQPDPPGKARRSREIARDHEEAARLLGVAKRR